MLFTKDKPLNIKPFNIKKVESKMMEKYAIL
jgi:ribosomal protein S17E